MNACLRDLATQIVERVPRRARRARDRGAPSILSQNDGTLMSVDYAERYPVATFASGPTNSMRGAGVPLRASRLRRRRHRRHDLRRRRPPARLPARGLGRGRHQRRADELPDAGRALARPRRRQHRPPRTGDEVGPDSVGYELTRRALVFGGDTTDRQRRRRRRAGRRASATRRASPGSTRRGPALLATIEERDRRAPSTG